MTGDGDVTVLIPLHRSRPFEEIVSGNLQRLAGRVRIVVSDATGDDDALDRLRDRFAGVAGITWLAPRSSGHGWVDHCNDLVGRVGTDFHMLLPHDDDVDLAYVQACRAAFDGDPRLVASVGLVESVDGEGLQHRHLPLLRDVDATGYRYPANAYLAQWNLGLLFRAVCRTDAFRPIPHVAPNDAHADSVWAYGMCLAGPIRQLEDVVYRKRFYADSTHMTVDAPFLPRTVPHLAREIESRLSAEDTAFAIAEMEHAVAVHGHPIRAAHPLQPRPPTLRRRISHRFGSLRQPRK